MPELDRHAIRIFQPAVPSQLRPECSKQAIWRHHRSSGWEPKRVCNFHGKFQQLPKFSLIGRQGSKCRESKIRAFVQTQESRPYANGVI